MEIVTTSAQETAKFAEGLAHTVKPGAVLALYGDLGSGKTTFTRFLVAALGIVARVQSPTFVIARNYCCGEGPIRTVHHLDLYRLTTQEEVAEIGLEQFFEDENALTVIEWPEIGEAYLPADTIKMVFEYVSENERKISVQDIN